jgi:FlaA1/EpsC-like NDP-sugar epimerase
VGLRPGEKLYEELLIGDNPIATTHPRIMKAQEQFMPIDTLLGHVHQLHIAAETEDLQGIKAVLQTCVHGFHAQLS